MRNCDEGLLWAGWTEIVEGDRTGGWGVYALVNTVTSRALISGSNDIAKRLWDARRSLERGRHWNKGVQADLDLHGAATFRLFLVQRVESATLLKITKYAEQHRAASRGLSYNIKPVYRCRAKRRIAIQHLAARSPQVEANPRARA